MEREPGLDQGGHGGAGFQLGECDVHFSFGAWVQFFSLVVQAVLDF